MPSPIDPVDVVVVGPLVRDEERRLDGTPVRVEEARVLEEVLVVGESLSVHSVVKGQNDELRDVGWAKAARRSPTYKVTTSYRSLKGGGLCLSFAQTEGWRMGFGMDKCVPKVLQRHYEGLRRAKAGFDCACAGQT